VDFRASTLRTIFGEKIVLRILDHRKGVPPLEELGFSAASLEVLRHFLRHQHGMILVVGPTGSGKTTTLYAGLGVLNDATRNILTIEDPVEYAVPGVGQTQVNTKVGMSFAAGLRAILRQDPDVVMVGEIRDVETAQIAVQASLTGHLVFSTVHTNDAVGAITRLRDMGIEPFLLASTLRLILAQRLVRKLCPACRNAEAADAPSARLLSAAPGITIFRAKGCAACSFTGYAGRIGFYEAVPVDDRLRRLIGENAAEDDLAAHAFAAATPLREIARLAVLQGVTTLEEAMRVTRQEIDHGEL
jgi:general secretion pathway protein E